MKKLLAFVLVAMMVLSLSVVAMAEEETPALKFVGEPFTTKGDVHDVKLVAENMKDITMFQFAVVYDVEALAVKAVVPDARFSGILVNYTTEPGVIYINWDEPSFTPTDISGTIATFTFEALADNDGATKIGFHDDPDEFLLGDANFAEIPVEDVEVNFDHEHVFDDWKVTTNPGCDTEGVETGYCHVYEDCTETTTKPIEAAGHKYGDWAEKTPATCVNGGTDARTCSVCGDEDTKETPALGHDMPEEWTETKPATCTEPGEKEKACLRQCGHTETEEIKAKGHEWGPWQATDVTAECGKPGVEKHVCGVCGDEETRATDALDHDWSGEWVETKPATCTEPGEKEKACARGCGEVAKEVIEALGHDMNGEWVETKPATCTEPGEKEKACLRQCGHTETEAIEKLGHDMSGEWVETKPATCTEPGEKEKTCLRQCGHTETEAIEKLGHSFTVWNETEPATCTEAGVEESTCDRDGCDETDEREVKALGHSFTVWDETKPATCTEPGVEESTCDRDGCGEIKERDIKALGHKLGDWVVVKEPEGMNDGIERRDCERCDYYEERTISNIFDLEATVTINMNGKNNGASDGETNPNTGASVMGIAVMVALGCAAAFKKNR